MQTWYAHQLMISDMKDSPKSHKVITFIKQVPFLSLGLGGRFMESLPPPHRTYKTSRFSSLLNKWVMVVSSLHISYPLAACLLILFYACMYYIFRGLWSHCSPGWASLKLIVILFWTDVHVLGSQVCSPCQSSSVCLLICRLLIIPNMNAMQIVVMCR